jgi:hypothetical protein
LDIPWGVFIRVSANRRVLGYDMVDSGNLSLETLRFHGVLFFLFVFMSWSNKLTLIKPKDKPRMDQQSEA